MSKLNRLLKVMPLLCLFNFYLQAQNCTTPSSTFTVHLPIVHYPTDDEGQGWVRPHIWNGELANDDSIVVPNGRPIYALIVSGYASNKNLDEMMLYRFARQLMDKGAYVHYAWWNNLLAPYMERPLHSDQSHPGSLTPGQLLDFATAASANTKALPGEDYQFVEDAKKFLSAIRANNPNAIIIVAGHSMGGGAVVHLGSQANELIDILAPIDPVGNRNFPFAGPVHLFSRFFNWTRWRVSRDNFLGFKKFSNTNPSLDPLAPPICEVTGPWLPEIATADLKCIPLFFVHDAPTLSFGNNIVNLFHRYQKEASFPFDYNDEFHFGHIQPANGTTSQAAVATKSRLCGLLLCEDAGGWPSNYSQGVNGCCPPPGNGVGWSLDGHGEIIGYRGPVDEIGYTGPVPLGVKLRTSPYCGNGCTNLSWPARQSIGGIFSNGDAAIRKQKLIELESYTVNQPWENAPYNPFLCLVSTDLIELYFAMNKPPTAEAGADQTLECTGPNGVLVTLNGSASNDPDADNLTYSWTGSFGTRTGQIVPLTLPMGTHCITLTIRDPTGHIDKDQIIIKVQDTKGPVVSVSITPNKLWPPNHKLIDITANVSATDLCGTVSSLVLHSIVASEDANVIGSGNTSPDIVNANYNTFDLSYKLRAERSGTNARRVYTVTYKGTDNVGNISLKSAEVIVENPSATTRSNQQQQSIDQPETEPYKSYFGIYPNPFSNTTRIQYYIPESGSVKLVVYDILGKEINTLVNNTQQQGYKYVDFDGSNLSQGVYTVKITTGTFSVTKKMIVLK